MLKQYRVAKGYTQEQLAFLLGTNRAAVSMIENGKQGINAERLERWLDACGVRLEISTDQPTTLGRLGTHAEALSPVELETLITFAELLPRLDNAERKLIAELHRSLLVKRKSR